MSICLDRTQSHELNMNCCCSRSSFLGSGASWLLLKSALTHLAKSLSISRAQLPKLPNSSLPDSSSSASSLLGMTEKYFILSSAYLMNTSEAIVAFCSSVLSIEWLSWVVVLGSLAVGSSMIYLRFMRIARFLAGRAASLGLRIR